jgi:hypothetical protein
MKVYLPFLIGKNIGTSRAFNDQTDDFMLRELRIKRGHLVVIRRNLEAAFRTNVMTNLPSPSIEVDRAAVETGAVFGCLQRTNLNDHAEKTDGSKQGPSEISLSQHASKHDEIDDDVPGLENVDLCLINLEVRVVNVLLRYLHFSPFVFVLRRFWRRWSLSDTFLCFWQMESSVQILSCAARTCF